MPWSCIIDTRAWRYSTCIILEAFMEEEGSSWNTTVRWFACCIDSTVDYGKHMHFPRNSGRGQGSISLLWLQTRWGRTRTRTKGPLPKDIFWMWDIIFNEFWIYCYASPQFVQTHLLSHPSWRVSKFVSNFNNAGRSYTSTQHCALNAALLHQSWHGGLDH